MSRDRAGLNESGYKIVSDVFSSRDCERLITRLSANDVAHTKAGARHLLAIDEVAAAATDPRMLDIARHALDSAAIPFRATLFEKSHDANWLIYWHQDTALPIEERFDAAGWGPWSVKAGVHYAHAPDWALSRVIALRLHLDASHAANGPLRILPGTHRLGVLSGEAIHSLSREKPAIDCLVERGGVLLMYPLIVHASSKSTTDAPRRVLHIEYAASRTLTESIRLALA